MFRIEKEKSKLFQLWVLPHLGHPWVMKLLDGSVCKTKNVLFEIIECGAFKYNTTDTPPFYRQHDCE